MPSLHTILRTLADLTEPPHETTRRVMECARERGRILRERGLAYQRGRRDEIHDALPELAELCCDIVGYQTPEDGREYD